VRPGHDAAIARRMTAYYDERYGLSDEFIKVPEFAIPRADPFGIVPCAR
jgi:formylmethanofuran dehydrogenase subunit A